MLYIYTGAVVIFGLCSYLVVTIWLINDDFVCWDTNPTNCLLLFCVFSMEEVNLNHVSYCYCDQGFSGQEWLSGWCVKNPYANTDIFKCEL